MKPVQKWRCDECGDQHNTEENAVDCCMPTVTEGWECVACGDFHEDEQDAIDCCGEGDAEANHDAGLFFPKHPMPAQEYIAEFHKINGLIP